MRIVLHVGMHKTGTSAIQTALEDNKEYLKAEGWVYSFLPNEFPSLYQFIKNRASNVESARSEVKEFFLNNSGMNILISHEVMSSSIQEISNWERKAQIIKEAFSEYGELEVIVYYRRQDDYYESAFQQIMKGGGDRNLQDIMDEYPPLKVMNWNRKIDRYLSIIDPKQSILVNYDEDKANLVERFLGYLDISFEGFDLPESNRSVNKSSFYSTLYFSLFGPIGNRQENKLFIKKLSQLDEELDDPKKYRLLPKELRKRIFETYYESNLKLLAKSINGNVEIFESWKESIENQVSLDNETEDFLIKGLVKLIMKQGKNKLN